MKIALFLSPPEATSQCGGHSVVGHKICIISSQLSLERSLNAACQQLVAVMGCRVEGKKMLANHLQGVIMGLYTSKVVKQ